MGNYANWKPVASADFDQNYEPISPTYPGSVSSSYTVRNGDTLQSIARTVWGDSAMWYLIADANGLTSGSVLNANQVLIIPNKVTNIHNNAGTFRPYNPGEAIGDLNPTIPAMPKPPKKKRCGGIGAIISAIVTVVVSIYLGPIVGKIAAAVLGNVAGQLVGIATGAQKGFNFASFALSAVPIAPFGTGATGLNGALQAAGNAAVSNVASQGLNIITGQQKGFSWSSVAVSGLGAAAGQFANKQLGINSINNPVAQDLARGAVNAGANALSQLVVRGGKINWQQVATDTILNFTSSRVQGYVDNKNAELVAQQREAMGNTTSVASLEARDRYLDMSTAGSRGITDVPVGEKRYGEQKDLLGTNPSAGGLSIKEGVAESVKNNAQSTNNVNAINKANLGGVDQAFSNIAADAVNQYYDIKDAYALGDQIKFNRALYERALSDTGQSRFTEPAQNPINLRVNNFLASQQSLASSLDNYATYGSIAFENAGKVGPLKNLIPMPYKQSLVANASLADGASQFVDRSGKTATLLTNNARTYGAAARGLSGVGNVFSVYDEFLFNQSVVLSAPNRQALVNTSSVVSVFGDVAATAGGARIGAYAGVGLSAIPVLTPFSPWIIPISTGIGGGAGHFIYQYNVNERVRQFFGLPSEFDKK